MIPSSCKQAATRTIEVSLSKWDHDPLLQPLQHVCQQGHKKHDENIISSPSSGLSLAITAMLDTLAVLMN